MVRERLESGITRTGSWEQAGPPCTEATEKINHIPGIHKVYFTAIGAGGERGKRWSECALRCRQEPRVSICVCHKLPRPRPSYKPEFSDIPSIP